MYRGTVIFWTYFFILRAFLFSQSLWNGTSCRHVDPFRRPHELQNSKYHEYLVTNSKKNLIVFFTSWSPDWKLQYSIIILCLKKNPSRAGLRSFCPKVIYHIFQFSQEKPQISHPLVAKKNTLITPSKILQAQKLWITLLLICGSLYKHCKTTKWGIQPESKAQH